MKNPIFRRLFLFLAIMGPGIITSNVDNDAGGITTYSVAGAALGYKILWLFLPMIVALVVIQEMCTRMGAVTGKGLADLIRERFGVRIAFYAMAGLFLGNLGNIMSEFAGVAASMELFGVTKYICAAPGGVVHLVAGAPVVLQSGGAGISGRLPGLFRLHLFRLPGPPGLGDGS